MNNNVAENVEVQKGRGEASYAPGPNPEAEVVVKDFSIYQRLLR